VIVLDPAHGGADTGAHGEGTLAEKDIVLVIARMARVELERQGYRVVLTRNDDSDPSYDDRATIANAYHDAIFISFHISSTGAPGTARVYSYEFAAPPPPPPPIAPVSANGKPLPPVPFQPVSSLTTWADAQRSHLASSRRLAEILQVILAQRLAGSPAAPAQIPVRDLRSIAAPAIAVELSSISVADANSLINFGPPLALAIEQSVHTFRPPASSTATEPH
jgi:N-acetylmuramoyl-L-alanine amidase